MKRLLISGVALVMLTGIMVPVVQADEPKAAAKLDARELHIYPYCGTEGSHLFDSKDRKIFNELKVSIESGTRTKFRISGKKKVDNYPYKDALIYHLGKLVLTPLTQRSGTVTTEFDKDKEGAPTHYLAFLLNDGTLKSTTVTLTKGHAYSWIMDRGETTSSLTVKDGETVVLSHSAPTDQVREFGFATTVRFVGDAADMTVVFDQ